MKRDANPVLAARMADIEAFHVMDVQNRAHELEAAGRRIVHMEIGQPDFAAPPLVAEAAIEAIRQRRLGYTASIGIPELRQAISDHYRERFGVTVPSSRIVVTAGASGAFLLTLGVLVNPGDEVLSPATAGPAPPPQTVAGPGAEPRRAPAAGPPTAEAVLRWVAAGAQFQSTKTSTTNWPTPISARTGAGRRAACCSLHPPIRPGP